MIVGAAVHVKSRANFLSKITCDLLNHHMHAAATGSFSLLVSERIGYIGVATQMTAKCLNRGPTHGRRYQRG